MAFRHISYIGIMVTFSDTLYGLFQSNMGVLLSINMVYIWQTVLYSIWGTVKQPSRLLCLSNLVHEPQRIPITRLGEANKLLRLSQFKVN